MKIRKFNESININNKDVNSLKEEFQNMFQEIEDDGIQVHIKIFVSDDKLGKHFNTRVIKNLDLFSAKYVNTDMYAAIKLNFSYTTNGWAKFDEHPAIEISKIVELKKKNYDYDFYIDFSDYTIEVFILTDILLMSKENLKKFDILIDKGLDADSAYIQSENSIEVGLFSGQLRGTILNLRGGNEIENPGLKRLFNNNYILDQNIIKLK